MKRFVYTTVCMLHTSRPESKPIFVSSSSGYLVFLLLMWLKVKKQITVESRDPVFYIIEMVEIQKDTKCVGN